MPHPSPFGEGSTKFSNPFLTAQSCFANAIQKESKSNFGTGQKSLFSNLKETAGEQLPVDVVPVHNQDLQDLNDEDTPANSGSETESYCSDQEISNTSHFLETAETLPPSRTVPSIHPPDPGHVQLKDTLPSPPVADASTSHSFDQIMKSMIEDVTHSFERMNKITSALESRQRRFLDTVELPDKSSLNHARSSIRTSHGAINHFHFHGKEATFEETTHETPAGVNISPTLVKTVSAESKINTSTSRPLEKTKTEKASPQSTKPEENKPIASFSSLKSDKAIKEEKSGPAESLQSRTVQIESLPGFSLSNKSLESEDKVSTNSQKSCPSQPPAGTLHSAPSSFHTLGLATAQPGSTSAPTLFGSQALQGSAYTPPTTTTDDGYPFQQSMPGAWVCWRCTKSVDNFTLIEKLKRIDPQNTDLTGKSYFLIGCDGEICSGAKRRFFFIPVGKDPILHKDVKVPQTTPQTKNEPFAFQPNSNPPPRNFQATSNPFATSSHSAPTGFQSNPAIVSTLPPSQQNATKAEANSFFTQNAAPPAAPSSSNPFLAGREMFSQQTPQTTDQPQFGVRTTLGSSFSAPQANANASSAQSTPAFGSGSRFQNFSNTSTWGSNTNSAPSPWEKANSSTLFNWGTQQNQNLQNNQNTNASSNPFPSKSYFSNM